VARDVDGGSGTHLLERTPAGEGGAPPASCVAHLVQSAQGSRSNPAQRQSKPFPLIIPRDPED